MKRFFSKHWLLVTILVAAPIVALAGKGQRIRDSMDFDSNVTISGLLKVSSLHATQGSPAAAGSQVALTAQSYTDNATAASGTATVHAFNGVAQPTLIATNTSVATTNAETWYIGGGPINGTNETTTTNAALFIDSAAAVAGTNAYSGLFKSPTGATTNEALGLQVGTSTAFSYPIGIVQVNVTPVGNAGSCAAPNALITYTIPANALNQVGRGVRITSWGTTANNATAKTINFAWGAQTFLSKALTASVAGTWKTIITCYKSGSNTQACYGDAYNNSGSAVAAADGATVVLQSGALAGTQTDTSGIVVGPACITNANAASDIVQSGQTVEFVN